MNSKDVSSIYRLRVHDISQLLLGPQLVKERLVQVLHDHGSEELVLLGLIPNLEVCEIARIFIRFVC